MKILVDTHCWLWWIENPEQLGEKAQKLIQDPENELLFSAASTWEMAIKIGLGRLKTQKSLDHIISHIIEEQSAIALPIYHSHGAAVATLPPIHKDPFDRLLIVQAKMEKAALLTADRVFQKYEIPLMNALT